MRTFSFEIGNQFFSSWRTFKLMFLIIASSVSIVLVSSSEIFIIFRLILCHLSSLSIMLFLFILILSHFSLQLLENLSSVSSPQCSCTHTKNLLSIGTWARTVTRLNTDKDIDQVDRGWDHESRTPADGESRLTQGCTPRGRNDASTLCPLPPAPEAEQMEYKETLMPKGFVGSYFHPPLKIIYFGK